MSRSLLNGAQEILGQGKTILVDLALKSPGCRGGIPRGIGLWGFGPACFRCDSRHCRKFLQHCEAPECHGNVTY